jgi:hypothetical protein
MAGRVRVLLATLAVTGLGAGLAACGSSSTSKAAGGATTTSGPSTSTTAAATTTSTASSSRDYCQLLTTAQASQLMGLAVTSTNGHPFVGGAGCTWRSSNSEISVTLDVNLQGDSSRFVCSSSIPGVQTVQGVGDQGFFCGTALTAKKGSFALALEVPGTPAKESDFVADANHVFQELGA